MAEQPTRNDEPDVKHSKQVDRDLGFFQDSELFVVLLGAVFGFSGSIFLASLLFKSTPVMVAAGLLGAYFGGIRLPSRIYGTGRLKAGFVRQLDEMTKELNRVLRGQLVEAIFAVVWMSALGYFVEAWKAENLEKKNELAAILILIPIIAVVRRVIRRRITVKVDASATAETSVITQVVPAAIPDVRNRTELRHMTFIVLFFATANLLTAIGLTIWNFFAEPLTLGRFLGVSLLFSVALIPSLLAFVGGFAMAKRQEWKLAMWGPKAVMGILWPLPIFSQVFGLVAYSKLRQLEIRELFASERRGRNEV